MSHNAHYSTAGVDLALNALLDVLNGGTIVIYDGAQPPDCDTPVSTQTALVTLTFGSPAFAAASGGSKAAHPITSGTAGHTSTATWFRCFNGGTAVADGTVGVGSGFDLNISTTSIVSGNTVACSALTFTLAK